MLISISLEYCDETSHIFDSHFTLRKIKIKAQREAD